MRRRSRVLLPYSHGMKKEKEVVFYLHNPYPDCLEIPAIMKQRFPDDYKSIVTSSLEEFKKYRGQV